MVATPEVHAPQAFTLGVYAIPTPFLNASYLSSLVVYQQTAQEVQVPQAFTLAVIRGKNDNPKLISWSYTLDGHDFYVLRLGTGGKTLVFDLTTQQWSWFASGNDIRWRPQVGMNWRSSGTIPGVYGSNIVCGDDTLPTLWVLAPLSGLDDDPTSDGQVTFPRVATGQMTQRGRNSTPIYSAYLTCSLGDPALTLNTVTFDYSDDQGQSYITADKPQIAVTNNYQQEFVWRSMGQVRAPGRLFRITDNGAFARIDSLDINDNEGA